MNLKIRTDDSFTPDMIGFYDCWESNRDLLQDQRQALEESIVHWRYLRRATVEKNRDKILDEGFYADSCACCARFFAPWIGIWERALECDRCPISDYTGQGNCEDTPYFRAQGALSNVTVLLRHDDPGGMWERARRNVEREVEFLKEVLKWLVRTGG